MKDKQTTRQIVRDRSLPGPEQISRHQDFTRLSQDYTMIKKLLAKKIMLWSGAGLITIAAVTGLLILNSANENTANKEVAVFSTTEEVKEAFVKPPFPGHETPYTVYRISTKNGGVIHYPTGSVLTIPPNSFYSKDGQPLSDSIDIKYREFHDPLSIFLAGIPMHYDSGGVHNTLESAGMLEIRAFDNGKDLSLREETPIHVKMASATNDTRYNLYELDTLLRNWVYKGKDKVEEFKKNKKQIAAKKEIHESAAPELVKPTLSDPNKFSFRIAYDKQEFPELAAYEHVLFEVTDHDFKPAYFKINWNKISLYSGSEPGRYMVSLKKADTTISVNAKPVFDRGNYDAAIEEFEQRHQQASKERDAEEFKKQSALNEVNQQLEAYSSAYMLNALVRQANMPYARLFTIRSVGYHNMDFPIPSNEQYAFNVRRVIDESRKLEAEKRSGKGARDASAYNTIFLVEQGKNTVFRFSRNEPVRCDPKAKNLMWTLTDKNEIAFFRIADYTRLANGGENRITPVVAANQTLAFAEIRTFTQEGK